MIFSRTSSRRSLGIHFEYLRAGTAPTKEGEGANSGGGLLNRKLGGKAGAAAFQIYDARRNFSFGWGKWRGLVLKGGMGRILKLPCSFRRFRGC